MSIRSIHPPFAGDALFELDRRTGRVTVALAKLRNELQAQYALQFEVDRLESHKPEACPDCLKAGLPAYFNRVDLTRTQYSAQLVRVAAYSMLAVLAADPMLDLDKIHEAFGEALGLASCILHGDEA